jgi:methylenetetrahydrofolate reductase (NADPH)
MRLIADIYASAKAARRTVISFEFFPPKTEEGERNLLEKTIPALLQTRPDYCSVTFGAGGGTRDKTVSLVDRIQQVHQLAAVAHLTCVGSTRDQIRELLAEYQARGIMNVLALRGDPPGGGPFQPVPGGFEYSSQLVRFIGQENGFCVGVAGFPEGHIACAQGKHADWGHLREKVDAGAHFVLTQLFFDNRDFYEFRDHMVQQLKVQVPIVPGIISILGASQIKKFTALCGARVPAALGSRLEQLGDRDSEAMEFGIEYATRQCEDLLRNGVPGFHFYTLNRAHSTTRILQNLGLAGSAG